MSVFCFTYNTKAVGLVCATWLLRASWSEAFSTVELQLPECAVMPCSNRNVWETLTHTEQCPSEDQRCQCQGLEPRYQGTASGAESGVCRCSSSHPLRRTNQPCNLRRDKEKRKIFLVLSDCCASCKQQRPQKSASSDLSCCVSSTKKPLTRTSHSWELKSVVLIGKHSPWHDFVPYNI